jgi:hypothetical protein
MPICVQSSPVETRSTTPHSQMGPLPRVTGDQLARIPPHEDAEVVLGFGEQAVGVDQLEAVLALQGVELVEIPVDQDGRFVAVTEFATAGSGERVLDRPLRAGMIELFPQPGEEVREPACLLGSRRQPGIGCRPPDLRHGIREDLESSAERETELVQRSTEPLHEQGSPLAIETKELRTALAAGETQDGRLVRRCITPARHQDLECGRCTVLQRGLEHQCFGPTLVGSADGDRPVDLEARDEFRECVDPVLGVGRPSLAPNDGRYVDHAGSLSHPSHSRLAQFPRLHAVVRSTVPS